MKRKTLHRQSGLTLVELMVATVLMLLVTMASVALFNVSSSSYRTVDAGQELQDNARFAFEIIGQAARSAGYQERTGPTATGDLTDRVFGPTVIDAWRVQGANNAQLSGGSSLTIGANNGVNNSDALVVRFFGSNMPDPANPAVPKFSGTFPVPDGSMIDCSGRRVPYPGGSLDVGVSAFFVKVLNGEPELYCLSWNANDATPSFSTSQIIRGVETFQVMYGVDTDADGIANRWISATADLDNPLALVNWNTVVAMRVGMVLRGPVGSAQVRTLKLDDLTDEEKYYFPLGKDFTCGSSCGSPEDGLRFAPANPNDGRLRRAFATTFLFRNAAT